MHRQWLLVSLLISDLNPIVGNEHSEMFAWLEQRDGLFVDVNGIGVIVDRDLLIENVDAASSAIVLIVDSFEASTIPLESVRTREQRTDVDAEIVQHGTEGEIEFDDAVLTNRIEWNLKGG